MFAFGGNLLRTRGKISKFRETLLNNQSRMSELKMNSQIVLLKDIKTRRNEEVEPKKKQCSVVSVSGECKVQCCKEYCIEIWNVRPMNQGKLEVVKQDMAMLEEAH